MSRSSVVPTARIRIAATVVVAALVPVVWWSAVGESLARADRAYTLAAMVALSVLFWGGVSTFLVFARPANPLACALWLGLFSTPLCGGVAAVLGTITFPFEVLLGTPMPVAGLGVLTMVGCFACPYLFWPVGLAMGATAYCITAGSADPDPGAPR